MVGVEGMVYIGNHGLERWERGTIDFVPGVEGYLDKVAQALRELKKLLALDGIAFEDKVLALSIHYRQCLDRENARRYILEKISTATIAREFSIIEGRMVVELRPPLKVNKGHAVLALVERYRLQGGICLGDDISDIDAFAAIHSSSKSPSFEGLAVVVIEEETSPLVEKEADFTLHGVGDIERFLKWLAETVAALRH
jgi:trehalose 6-phosphate phosphatase